MVRSYDFDWSNADQDNLVVHPQLGVAVYRNEYGRVVVRQQGEGNEEDDFVVLNTDAEVRALIAALQREVDSSARGG